MNRKDVEGLHAASSKSRTLSNEFGKSVLPPIMRQTDKNLIEEIRKFIDKEKQKLECDKDVYDEKRFAIYSSALDKIVDNTTAYKDLLADIKHEYDGCINAITRGQREATFLTKKVKTYSSLPTTISGYNRRKIELQEKLETLNEANNKLQEKYNKIKQTNVKLNKVNKDENPVETLLNPDELRPIPGLSVDQWTDAETLKQSLIKLGLTLDDLNRQQKTNYVLKNAKDKSDTLLNERLTRSKRLTEEVKNLHLENSKLKVAHDAMISYRKKTAENPWFKMSIDQYIIGRLATQQMMDKKMMSSSVDIQMDEEDLETEKEAELMLEYIDKFNELFNDGEYDNAAVHAANSPRGILRTMETLIRFRDVSLNCTSSPSPLLLYAIALMNSSTAQCHVADKQMSIICAEWALRENRPDLIKHWTATGCITSSNQIAHSLVEYSNNVPEYKPTCLAVAQKMFGEVGNHLDACIILYQLQQFKALIEYTKETAEFTKNDYMELIKHCPDGALILNLCRQQINPNINHDQFLSPKVLPLRYDNAIYKMITSHKADKEEVSRFLNGLCHCDWTSYSTGEKIAAQQTLHTIVYDETDADNSSSKWPNIIEYCESNDLLDVALEIKAAITVKQALLNSFIALGQAGKEEFDYYT